MPYKVKINNRWIMVHRDKEALAKKMKKAYPSLVKYTSKRKRK